MPRRRQGGHDAGSGPRSADAQGIRAKRQNNPSSSGRPTTGRANSIRGTAVALRRVSPHEEAWTELLAATPGWFVGTPVYHVERVSRR